jgi:hypothetical protein
VWVRLASIHKPCLGREVRLAGSSGAQSPIQS